LTINCVSVILHRFEKKRLLVVSELSFCVMLLSGIVSIVYLAVNGQLATATWLLISCRRSIFPLDMLRVVLRYAYSLCLYGVMLSFTNTALFHYFIRRRCLTEWQFWCVNMIPIHNGWLFQSALIDYIICIYCARLILFDALPFLLSSWFI